jgi:hypothetical protein
MRDYERAKREAPALKSALTRAKKITDPTARMYAVIEACRKAVKAWNVWGAWPDGWHLWKNSLDDAIRQAWRAGFEGPLTGCETLEDLA